MCNHACALKICGLLFAASIICGTIAMLPQHIFPEGIRPVYFLLLATVFLAIGCILTIRRGQSSQPQQQS